MIALHGRPMVLTRPLTVSPPAFADVDLTGFFRAFQPHQMTGDIRQGDARVEISGAEIAAAGWPGPPRPRDMLRVNGSVWLVQGVAPIYDGADPAGYTLHIRGGSA
jgi:hypothetical protein